MTWFFAQTSDVTTEWLDVVREYGAVAVLAVVAVFLVRAWRGAWFYSKGAVEKLEAAWDARYKDMKSERDTWRDLAINGTEMAARALRVAETSE